MTTPKTPSGSRPKRRPPIRALSGEGPHPSYGGWRKFLEKHCEVRGEFQGVTWYGTTNCNYILFPCGTLVENYGYHGRALMNEVRQRGPARTLARIVKQRQELHAAMGRLCGALKKLTAAVGKARRVKQRREKGGV